MNTLSKPLNAMARHQLGMGKPEIAMPPLPEEIVEQQAAPVEDNISSTADNMSTDEQVVEQIQQESVQQIKVEQKPSQAETAQAKNFRELRDKAERVAQERDELARRIKELESSRNKEEFSLAPDDLVEGKHLSRHVSELKEVKEQLKRYEQHMHQNTVESKLRSKYSDFDSMVTADNLAKLNPSVARSLQALAATDLEAAGEAAYEVIKSLTPTTNKYTHDVELAQKNSVKPRPLTSVSPQHGDSPLSKANAFANGLTPELQQQLLKEMQNARKAY